VIRRIAHRVAVAGMLAGLVTGFILWWSDVMRTRQVRMAAPTLVAATQPMDPAASGALASALRAAIVAAPLDQDLVNRFYTLATVNRLVDDSVLAGWRAQLTRLGWRSNGAQQNLLVAAAYAGDLPTLLDRTDAMMRRKALAEELGVLLYTIEQAPQTHNTLVLRLRRNVPWRTTFFADPRGVATPAGRQARLATISEMLDAHNPVARVEVAPLLVALTTARDNIAAFRIWRRFRMQDRQERPLVIGETFDPDFAAYRAAQHLVPVRDLPFEWQAVSGEGYSTDVADDGVTLHWDGSGVPLMLRQTFHAVPGMYELLLTGTDAKPEFLNRFEVAALCPQGETLFVTPRQRRAGEFAVTADRAVPCEFPILLVRGRASMVPQPVDASLTSILLHPVRG